MTKAERVGRAGASNRAWRRALVAALAVCALGAARNAPAHAAVVSVQVASNDEFAVKAAFLYHFARYVKWPKKAFPNDQAPLVVAVFGHDPFGRVLDDALRGKVANDRPIKLVRYATLKELQPCHLLYVPAGDSAQLAQLVEYFDGAPTLIVGESIEFAERGGAVGFYTENRKVRFAINTAAVKRHLLEVSSQLLKLARIVGDKVPRNP